MSPQSKSVESADVVLDFQYIDKNSWDTFRKTQKAKTYMQIFLKVFSNHSVIIAAPVHILAATLHD